MGLRSGDGAETTPVSMIASELPSGQGSRGMAVAEHDRLLPVLLRPALV